MEKIRASFIIEILGKPKEHVQEAMETILSRLGAEKGVKILDKRINEPVVVKDSPLFTTFADLSLEFDSISNLLGMMFAYMPSHVEINHPEKITLTNAELNDLGNVLMQRLHNYDAIAKKSLADREFIMKKLYEVAPHLFAKKENSIGEDEKPEDTKS